MSKTQNHIHKLRKRKYPSGNAVFFCTLPDCYHKVDVPLALGKKSLCNICGDEFIMNEYTLKLQKPHCEKCGKVKVKDKDGVARYVKKADNKILSNVAVDTTEDLRSRLNSALSPVVEDDI